MIRSKSTSFGAFSFAILFLIVSALFPIGPVKNLGSADAADYLILGDWIVTGTVIRSGDSITVDGNVSVKGTLVLDDCNLTIDGTISERHGMTIEAGGRLVLKNDTVLKGPTGGRFSFFAKALSLVRIENSTVIGCGFPTGLVSEVGVYSESSNFVIQNSTIGSGQNGLMAKGGTFSITSSTVIEMVSSGITLLEKSMMNGSSLMVRHIQGPGLLSDASIIRLDGSVFENVEISIDALNSTCAVNQSLLSTRTMEVFRLEGGSCIMQDVRPFLPGMDRGLLVSGPSGANLLLVNCSISDVAVVGSKATARWANRFDVIVTRNGGAPGAGAELEFLDRFGSRTAVGLTGSLGYAQDIIVPFYTKNQTFSSFLTPHNLSVFLEGALRFADVNVSLVDHVRIRVLFSTPEITIDAPGDGEWLKGSPVNDLFKN